MYHYSVLKVVVLSGNVMRKHGIGLTLLYAF